VNDPHVDVPSTSKGTQSGFHFLNIFQQCPWSWYLKYVVGFSPVFVSKFLSFGTAVHAALEEFYTSMRDGLPCSADMLVEVGYDALCKEKPRYAKQEVFLEDVERMPPMLRTWHANFAESDMRDYDVVEIEAEHEFEVPLGFCMTVRPDVVLRERVTKRFVVLEHKTTSRSVSGMAHSVNCTLQPDAQILGLAPALGVDASQIVVVPNILYKNKSVVKAERPMVISRSKRELLDAALNFACLFVDTTQRVSALDDPDYVPELLFPRNGAWCGNGMSCDFADVCRQRFTRDNAPPINFTKEAPTPNA
jgi:hypothetical protein